MDYLESTHRRSFEKGIIFTYFYVLQALRLNRTALGDTAPGKVVNLIANDVNRFEYVIALTHYMWSAPLSVLIVMYILYSEIGYTSIVGIIIMFMVVPIQCESF